MCRIVLGIGLLLLGGLAIISLMIVHNLTKFSGFMLELPISGNVSDLEYSQQMHLVLPKGRYTISLCLHSDADRLYSDFDEGSVLIECHLHINDHAISLSEQIDLSGESIADQIA